MRRKITLAVTVVIIIAAGIWVKSRWHAWFVQPEELPYTAADYPHRVLLTFGDESPLSRNVSWQCDTTLRDSHVELMSLADSSVRVVSAEGEVFASRAGKAAYYRALLRSLQPNHRYAYRVTTGDASSGWHTFKTGNPGSHKFSFIYTGDVQDTIGGISGEVLREAFRRFPEAEFIVCGGDLVERPTDQEWGVTFQLLDSLASGVTMLNATGNHDYLKSVPKKLERRFPLVFSYFLDSAQGENMVYTLNYGDARFFLLDSNRELPYLWQQRDWLRKALEKSDEKWKILVTHHPVYSIRRSTFIEKSLIKPLIDDYGVDLVLQGHEHNYARKTTVNDGEAKITPVYVISHLAPKNYRVKRREDYELIETDHRYVQLITIDGDTLRYASYRVPGFTLADSLTIINEGTRKQKRVIEP